MIDDPCKMCLVRACCKIQKYTVWWNCGCDLYETYRLWKSLSNYCNKNEYLTNIMMSSSSRMMQLKERQR